MEYPIKKFIPHKKKFCGTNSKIDNLFLKKHAYVLTIKEYLKYENNRRDRTANLSILSIDCDVSEEQCKILIKMMIDMDFLNENFFTEIDNTFIKNNNNNVRV